MQSRSKALRKTIANGNAEALGEIIADFTFVEGTPEPTTEPSTEATTEPTDTPDPA